MRIKLLQSGSLEVVIRAIRTCYDSMDKCDSIIINDEFILGVRDRELLKRVINSGHTSTIEHLAYTFHIEGISRGCLQELARHRIASLSVKSTRYTLGRIKEEEPFTFFPIGGGKVQPEYTGYKRSAKYLVRSEDTDVNETAYQALETLRLLAVKGIPNDQLKYCLPEAFKTELIWTINARSLINFLELRTASGAHWEIKAMTERIKALIPPQHTVLFSN